MKATSLQRFCSTSLAALVALSFAAPSARAQKQAQMSDGILSVSANMPETVRMSEQFTYQVTVRNTTDNVTLHDIKLRQRKAKGFSVESVSTGKSDQKSGKQSGQKSQSGNKKSGKKSDQKQKSNQKKSKQDQKKSGSEKKSDGQQNQKSGGQQQTLTINKLEPGQSKTLQVKAAADEKGQLNACLAIDSYKPSLCMTAKVVQPDLQLTKTAPKKVNRCDVIELTYGVKNTGSGKVDKFEIRDKLAEGLRTIEGNKQLKYTVDGGLDAGEVRKFVARVYATETGKFSSRAVAKAVNTDLKARSKPASTEVVAAELNANVSGGGTVYGNQPIAFTARVTNTGNAPAENVDIQLSWPQDAQLVDVSDPQRVQSDQSGSKGQSAKKQGQPTPAKQAQKNQDNKQGKNKKQGQNKKQREMNSRSLAIDGLKPGEAVEFRYVVRPGGITEIPTKVEASYVCAISAAEDKSKARAKITAMANGSANVMRVPALQVYAVDATDPVASGEQVQYKIRVRNEGNAPDNKIAVTANLPQGFQFEKADGPTDAKSTGSTVSFKPIDKLTPGDQVEYTLTAKTQGQGDKELQVKLESEALAETVTVAEPTRVFKGQATN